MPDVAGGDETQRSHREWITTGSAAPHPRFRRKVSHQRERGQANGLKLFNMARPTVIVRMRHWRPGVLIKAGQRAAIAARKGKGAIAEHSFCVIHMAQQLANAPLFRLVTI